MCEDLFIERRLFGFSLHFALELAEHDEFIRVGLLATAIEFQITEDKCAPAIAFQKDEWVGSPKFRRVKNVGICLAGGDDETGWLLKRAAEFCGGGGFFLRGFFFFFFFLVFLHFFSAGLPCFSSRAMRGTSQSKFRVRALASVIDQPSRDSSQRSE
jgi:hypothetical protein